MFKKLMGLALGFCFCFEAILFAMDGAVFETLTPNSANIAASTTDSTAGTVFQLLQGTKAFRLYVTGTGTAGTTNGTLVVKLSTATGANGTTNEFDTASQSNIKLTISTIGNATVTANDWFVSDGIRFVRIGQIENTFVAPVSNMTFRIGYQK